MILHDNLIVAPFVIVAIIVPQKRLSLNFGRSQAKEENLGIIQNFDLFIVCQALVLVKVESLARRHGKLRFTHADGRRRLIRIGTSFEVLGSWLVTLALTSWLSRRLVRVLFLNNF